MYRKIFVKNAEVKKTITNYFYYNAKYNESK